MQLFFVIQLEFLSAGEGEGGQLFDGDRKILRLGTVAENRRVQRALARFPPDRSAVRPKDLRPDGRVQAERVQLLRLHTADRVVIAADRARRVREAIALVKAVAFPAGAAAEFVPRALRPV